MTNEERYQLRSGTVDRELPETYLGPEVTEELSQLQKELAWNINGGDLARSILAVWDASSDMPELTDREKRYNAILRIVTEAAYHYLISGFEQIASGAAQPITQA